MYVGILMLGTSDACFLRLTAKALGTRFVEFNLLYSREWVLIFSVFSWFSHASHLVSLSCYIPLISHPYHHALLTSHTPKPSPGSGHHLFSGTPPQGLEKKARFKFSLRQSPLRGSTVGVPQPCHAMELSPLARCIPPFERARTPILWRSHADGMSGSCLRGSVEACVETRRCVGCAVLCRAHSRGRWRREQAQPYRARKHPDRRVSGEVTCCSGGGSFENRN